MQEILEHITYETCGVSRQKSKFVSSAASFSDTDEARQASDALPQVEVSSDAQYGSRVSPEEVVAMKSTPNGETLWDDADTEILQSLEEIIDTLRGLLVEWRKKRCFIKREDVFERVP